MAYIQNTAFEVKVSNHEFDSTANITGVFYASSAAAVCSAGFLCTRDALLQNEGYPSGIDNANTWKMVAATSSATANDPVYACNPHDVNEITDAVTGATYKVGSNTLGIPAPAGKYTTFTKIDFAAGDKQYRFGVGNLSTDLSTNGYATIADGLLVPAAAAPQSGPYFKVLGTGTFTQGAYAGFGYVDVEAHNI